MKVLWLASWYPNKISPLDGDFVQRHALAVSKFASVSVIYVVQYGESVPNPRPEVIETTKGAVRELRVYFTSLRTGIRVLDKLIYNWRYFQTYISVIRSYFSTNGVPDLVHVHVPMKAGMLARWIKKKWKIPYVVTEHSGTYVPGPQDEFSKRSLYFRQNVRSVFRGASAVTSVSFHNGRIIQDIFGLKTMHVIHNVVDISRFYYRPREREAKFRFIHVSTMGYNKNITGILQACSRLKTARQDWEIELIGPPNEEILGCIQKEGLEDIVFVKGEMSNEAVADRMQRASALVMFSRVENFPCTVIEALCCGLTVVSSDVGGISEAVNSSNGILVSSENEDQLLSAMNEVMDRRDSFERISIAADAVQKYSYHHIGKEFFELYNTVLSSLK